MRYRKYLMYTMAVLLSYKISMLATVADSASTQFLFATVSMAIALWIVLDDVDN